MATEKCASVCRKREVSKWGDMRKREEEKQRHRKREREIEREGETEWWDGSIPSYSEEACFLLGCKDFLIPAW